MDQPRHVIPALESVYRTFAPITEPLVRVIAGGSLAIHGFPILFGNTAAAAKFLESVGFENALFWAYVVGVVELVCGLCLAAGFLTRLVAAPIIGFLLIAIVTYHWQFGFAWENRGIEYPLFWAIVVFSFPNTGRGTMVCRCADRLRGVTR
jgi:putative oxidoreductase